MFDGEVTQRESNYVFFFLNLITWYFLQKSTFSCSDLVQTVCYCYGLCSVTNMACAVSCLTSTRHYCGLSNPNSQEQCDA